MARFRGLSRGRPVTVARQTAWGVGPGSTAASTINATGSQLVGSAITATVEGATVIRIRGEIAMYLTLATGVNDGFQGAFGIGIASLAAVTAGIGSVPTPITEQGSESWLYWAAFSIHGPVVSSTSLESGPTSQRFMVDTKAMRKLPTELVIYAALQSVEAGTATGQLFFDSRALVKLP